MLYEFSMTPELFDVSVVGSDKHTGVILVQILRGIAENGLLVNLGDDDNQWLSYVEKRREALPQALKDQVKECLSTLYKRHRLVRRPECVGNSLNTDQDWLNLALDSHKRIPFYAIILSQELMNSSGSKRDVFIEFFDSLNSKRWKGRKRTLSLDKSIAQYSSVLDSVLRYARSLKLIDPWFNPMEPRYCNTLEICSKILGQRSSMQTPRIDIHVSKNKEDNQILEKAYFATWKQKLEPLVKKYALHFRIFLWEPGPSFEPMHDRFILTDQCGISIPWGLDCLKHSNKSTDWNFLDEEVRLKRWKEYDPSGKPLSPLAGSREYFIAPRQEDGTGVKGKD